MTQRTRAALWAGLAGILLALTVWALVDAVRDLAAAPDFAGFLRLVVEAVTGAVAVGFCVTRARG